MTDETQLRRIALQIWTNHRLDRRGSIAKVRGALETIVADMSQAEALDTLALIEQRHGQWLHSATWCLGMVNALSKWLDEGMWQMEPCPPSPKEERELIRRDPE